MPNYDLKFVYLKITTEVSKINYILNMKKKDAKYMDDY